MHVLIVGAGPTGLTLALALRQHGISYRLIERGMGSRNRRLRRRRGGLADLHVNDMAAGRLDPRRRRHHVHHHEGRNFAARRRGQQAADTIS